MELDEYLALQKKTRRRPRHEESGDQCRFVRYVRAKHPLLPIFMSPIFKFSGTPWQRLKQGKRMKDMGYTPGTPDLMLPVRRRGYSGLIFELKTPEGKASVEQDNIIKFCQENGYFAVVVYGSNAAIKIFDWYMSGST